MGKIFVSRILIYSAKDRKAKTVNFKDGLNVILGQNDTGKSVILKSIFSVFGASVDVDQRWKEVRASILVDFSFNGKKYALLKWSEQYGLFFDGKVEVFNSVVKELGPRLAELFDFKMIWYDKEGNEVVPPPAYFLLPFYMDQDLSWAKSWSSFKNLYLPGISRDLIEYHTGLKPNEYYTTKVELSKVKKGIKEKEADIVVLDIMLKEAEEKLVSLKNISITADDFNSDVENIETEINELYTNQAKYKLKLGNLYSKKIVIEDQIHIVERTLQEINKDLKYASHDLDSTVECPTCGAHYENSFEERFSIAKDEYKCYELYEELNVDLGRLNAKIGEQLSLKSQVENKIKQFNSLLAVKKGNLVLKDLIKSEGAREVKLAFQSKINSLNGELREAKIKEGSLESDLSKLLDKDRRAKIRKHYKDSMTLFLTSLNVSLEPRYYDKIDSKVFGMGSAKPRFALAYFYSILSTMRKYGNSTFFPICIDEPDQQGQDNFNMVDILKFIKDNHVEGEQMILGLQSTMGVDFSSDVVMELDESSKFSLLDAGEFSQAHLLIRPYINALLKAQGDALGYN